MSKRVNFREVRDRFSHIDATLVSATFSVKPAQGQVTVNFYPWWEHPLYRQAIAAGRTWGFTSTSDGARDVSVFAVDPIAAHLSQRHDVTDWEFCEQHPVTWRYEDEGQIVCNSEPDVPRIIEAILSRELPWVTREVLNQYLSAPEWKPPFSLGYFPYTLYNVLREELEAANVRLHLPRAAEKRDSFVALVLNGQDYIVAADFELEVPEFEHRPEWFAPGA